MLFVRIREISKSSETLRGVGHDRYGEEQSASGVLLKIWLRGVKPKRPARRSAAYNTGETGMELSPKGSSFGDGLSRKRTVQEANQLSLVTYNSSAHTGTNDRMRGALNARRSAEMRCAP